MDAWKIAIKTKHGGKQQSSAVMPHTAKCSLAYICVASWMWKKACLQVLWIFCEQVARKDDYCIYACTKRNGWLSFLVFAKKNKTNDCDSAFLKRNKQQGKMFEETRNFDNPSIVYTSAALHFGCNWSKA